MTMEQILIESAKQVPSLVVLASVVWMNHRASKESLIAAAEERKLWRDSLMDIQRENLIARNESKEATLQNSAFQKENTIALVKLTSVVEESSMSSKLFEVLETITKNPTHNVR